jgi:hypothetical protein
MLEAERRRKLNLEDIPEDASQDIKSRVITRMEDVLTSNVFGILKNVDQSFTNSILGAAGIDGDFFDLKYDFWPKYDDGTEPDLVLSNDDAYILVEVKYTSDFGSPGLQSNSQIVRELKQGSKEAGQRKFYYLAVTCEEDVSWNEKAGEDIESDYSEHLYAISWNAVLKELQSSKSFKTDEVSNKFIDDLTENYLRGKFPEERAPGTRDLSHFLREEGEELIRIIKGSNYNISLKKKDAPILEFSEALNRYIIRASESGRIRKNKRNNIKLDQVPIEVFLNVDIGHQQPWFELFRYMFQSEFINVFGKRDFSAKLRTQFGEFSLFTYLRNSCTLKFQKLR